MYFAGVLTFFVALALYVTSRRSSLPAHNVRLRGTSYLLLGIALLLGAENGGDAFAWLVRVFGALTVALGSRCLLVDSKARSQPQAN